MAAVPGPTGSATPEPKTVPTPGPAVKAEPSPGPTAVPVAAAVDAPLPQSAPPAVFARCAVCHNAQKGAAAKIGPNLYGVYGTKAGLGSFAFSEPLKASGLVWSDETLDKWIAGPMAMVPGTLMAFPGIKDPAKRAEIIAFLKSQR